MQNLEMAHPGGQTSNQNPGALKETMSKPPRVDDLYGIMEMAHLDGNSLNQIFEELARWEAMLGEAEIEFDLDDPEP